MKTSLHSGQRYSESLQLSNKNGQKQSPHGDVSIQQQIVHLPTLRVFLLVTVFPQYWHLTRFGQTVQLT